MQTDFDQVINRKGTNSVKWEFTYLDGVFAPREMGDDLFAPDELLPLWVADMDFATPPAVIEALTARAQHGVFGYTAPKDDFYAAIVGWMQRRHNWTPEKEWILTAPGVVPSLNMIVQTFTDVGDGVLIQTPVYHPFYAAVENNGRKLVYNPMNFADGRYTMDYADLATKLADPATKLMILCSPHNPVGRVWSSDELKQVGDLCAKHDVLIVSDEIHHDLIYASAEFTTFANACPDHLDRAIICTAPSKTFNVPGLKTSNIFIPNADLRAQLTTTIGNLGLFGINSFGLVALQTAYNTGDEWLDAAMQYIADNLAYLKTRLAQHLPAVNVIEPEGTYLAWIDCRGLGLAHDVLYSKLLDEAKVYLNNGKGFGVAGEGFLRLNLACPRKILATALDRIIRVLA